MSGGNFRIRYRAASVCTAIILAIWVMIGIAACGSGKSEKSLFPPAGFDPCRAIPLGILNSWDIDPNPKPTFSIESDGSASKNPALKSCEYNGKVYGATSGLAKEGMLSIGMTTMSLGYFGKPKYRGNWYREAGIDGRKMAIKTDSYIAAYVPGPYTSCEIYVQMKGGGLLLNVEKAGDSCQLATDIVQKVVPLLPPGS